MKPRQEKTSSICNTKPPTENSGLWRNGLGSGAGRKRSAGPLKDLETVSLKANCPLLAYLFFQEEVFNPAIPPLGIYPRVKKTYMHTYIHTHAHTKTHTKLVHKSS